MKSTATLVLILIFSAAGAVFGQGGAQGGAAQGGAAQGGGRGGQQAPAPLTETVATSIPGVIAAGTKITPIKDGFQGTEGPITLPDGSLIFTETNANRITKIDKDNNVTTFLENTNGSNALAFDTRGRLISVQTVAGNTKVGVIYPRGSEAVLAENFDGKPFPRPNDLVVTKAGGVYFTDMPQGNPTTAESLTPAVYFIPPGGQVKRAAEGIERPNGIQLSRDERTLYDNNVQVESMLAFDIQADGSLTTRRNFAKYENVTRNAQGVINSQADGIAVDNAGRVYSAMPGGVQVFSPQGAYLGLIPTSRRVQNMAFAGADKKTLYMVGSGAAWKTQMVAEGFKDRAK